MVEVLETNFSMLVTGLKELDAIRRRAIDKPNASNVIFSACDTYCRSSKKTLRSTIQVVDKIIEDKSFLRLVTPGHSLDDVPRDVSNVVDFVVRVRANLLLQRALDSWRMYCRMKRIAEKRQSEMLLKLENAQKLAEGAKSEFVAAERKDHHLQDEVVRTRSEIASLLDRVSKLTIKLDQKDKEIATAVLENENLKTSNKRLMTLSRSRSPTKTAQFQNTVRTLNEQLEESSEEVNRLKEAAKNKKQFEVKRSVLNQISTDKIFIIPLKTNTSDLESRLKMAEDDVAQLSVDLRQADEEIEAVSNARETLEIRLGEKDVEIEQLQNQKTNLFESEKLIRNELVRTRHDLAAVNQELVQVTEELSLAREELVQSRGEEELLQAKGDLAKTQAEMKQMTGDLVQSRNESIQLKGELVQSQNESMQLKGELVQSREELKQAKQLLIQSQDESKQAKQLLIQSQNESKQAKQLFIQSQDESKQAKENLLQAREALKQANGDLVISQSDLTKLRNEFQQNKDLAESHSAELKMALGDLSWTKKDLAKAQKEVVQLRVELESLKESSRAELATLKHSSKNELIETRIELDQTRGELAKERHEIAQIKVELTKTQKALKEIEIELGNTRIALQETETKALPETDDRADLTRALQALSQAKTDLTLAQVSAEQEVSLRAELAQVRNELVTASAELGAARNLLTANDASAISVQAMLVSDYSQTDIAEELAQHVLRLEAQVDLLDSDLVAAENEIDQLNLRLSQKPEDVPEEQLRMRITALEDEIERMSDQPARLEAEKQLLVNELNEADEAHKRLQAQISELNQKLIQESSNFETIQRDLAQAETELDELAAEKNDLALELVEMQKERAQSNGTNDLADLLKADIALLNNKLAEADKDKELLIEKLSEADKENTFLKNSFGDKIASSDSEIVSLQSQLRVLEEKLVQANSDRTALADTVETQLRSELTQAELRMKESEAERVRLVEAELQLLADMRAGKAELEAGEIQRVTLQAKLRGAETDRVGLESRLTMVDTDRATLESELAAAEIEKDKLKAQLRGMGSDQTTLKTIQAELESMQQSEIDSAKLEARVKSLELEKAALEAKIFVIETSRAKNSDSEGMMETVKKLVDEKSLLSIRLQQQEQVIKDMANQARPNLALHPLSELVTVDAGGTIARYIGQNKDSDMSGCLITTTPLPMFDEGLYFEVRVTECTTGNPDGLTLGITTSVPEGTLVPNTLDDIPLTWAVGYNGQAWNGSKNEWKAVPWSGRDLVAGNRIGILIAAPPVSQLFVFVNDILACRGPSRLPSCFDYDYFGLVDLLGNCDAVTLLWGAQPPAAASDLVAVDPRKVNVTGDLLKRLPRRTNVSDIFTDESNASPISMYSPKHVALPRLPLKPTAQLTRPAKPPSAPTSDEEDM